MSSPEIPYIIYAEMTPNPASIKFVANKMIMSGGATANYASVEEASSAPLVKKLFEFPFVKQVFLAQNYITITRHDFIDWDDVLMETRTFLTQYLNAANPVINELPSKEMPSDNTFAQTQTVFTEHAVPQNEIEVKIIEILEEYIRPAVAQDGGLITFKSLQDGVVTVQMRGSCSGCPSSTLTLKAGIEGLLKRLMPDQIKEVVSEAIN